MDSKTRHALKQDKFVQATTSSIGWLGENRDVILKIALPAVIIAILAIGGTVLYTVQSDKADVELGSALTIYTGQLTPPGQPALPGLYGSTADRAKAANKGFSEVASKYAWLSEGRKALYFKGLTEVDLNQTGSAESDLKSVANHGGDLGNLAHVALANLYHATQRDAQAADELNAVVSKPSSTVSALTAQIYLGDLYQHSDPTKAKAIYAKVKDADKEGPLGSAAESRITSLK